MKFFSEAMDEIPPNGRIYLPTASYAEMGQWSMPSRGFVHYENIEKHLKSNELWEEYSYLVRGGFWRNFLSKYPESNNMHKKMYRVASKISSISNPSSTQKQKLEEALDLLYQGQCNCPYWHGVFGGLYLNHLRYATYNRFLQAEAIIDEIGGLPKSGKIDITDFDDDGKNEVLLETKDINAYFAPHHGGAMFELDLKYKGYNLLDTMTRREEGYHKKLTEVQEEGEKEGQSIHDRIESKEKNLDKYLIYDWHRRLSFIDHILPHQVDFEIFTNNDYQEMGDFILEPFECETKKSVNKLTAVLARDGNIYHPRGILGLTLTKAISVGNKEPIIEAKYKLGNRSESELSFVLGIEFNWAMLGGDAPDRFYYIKGQKLENNRCNSRGESGNVSEFGIKDEYHKLDINLNLSQPCRLWRHPIETVSLSEYGFERVYQSSVTCTCFDVKLPSGQEQEIGIVIKFLDI